MRVLLVTTDALLHGALQRALPLQHYRLDCVGGPHQALHSAMRTAYGCIIVDCELPSTDGWSLCSLIRRRQINAPILMLSRRADATERSRGLDLGADDFLTIPFAEVELAARVRALCRRDAALRGRRIVVGELTVDTLERSVLVGGSPLHLTDRQYTLLEALARNAGRPLSRRYILETVWHDDESYSNTVDVIVSQIRKKLAERGTEPLIQTVRGVGYMLRHERSLTET